MGCLLVRSGKEGDLGKMAMRFYGFLCMTVSRADVCGCSGNEGFGEACMMREGSIAVASSGGGLGAVLKLARAV